MSSCTADKCNLDIKLWIQIYSKDAATSGVVILIKELVLECKTAQCFLHWKYHVKKVKLL